MNAPTPTPTPTPAAEVLSLASVLTPQTLLGAALAFAILLVALYTFARRRSASRGNAVLLLGPSDAGKTAILSSLVYGPALPSHASSQTNTSELVLADGRPLRLVDVPGHPRIRGQFAEHLAGAKALVFVVDANTVSRSGPAVAEHLHHVLHALASLPPSQPAPAFALAAHKADLLKPAPGGPPPAQLAANRVRSVLERELERRRAALAGVDSEDALGGLDGGPPGQPFRFADWDGGEVAFLGTWTTPSEKTDEKAQQQQPNGLAELRSWLEEL